MSRHSEDFALVPRRDRVHLLREFILETFDLGVLQKGHVLDVAGGKGDLSFVFANANPKLRSVVVDPRYTDHSKIARTAHWYSTHPKERLEHAATTPQILPRLDLQPPFQGPLHLRLFFSDSLVNALRPRNQTNWKTYWKQACQRVQKLEASFPEHHQKKSMTDDDDANVDVQATVIASAEDAWEIFQSISLVVGFHPDEATDPCVDFALEARLPFVVAPCCVFPSFFPHRILQNKSPIRTYDDYLQYLKEKHPKMRQGRLPFASAAAGHGAGLTRNTVLYMLPCDYDD